MFFGPDGPVGPEGRIRSFKNTHRDLLYDRAKFHLNRPSGLGGVVGMTIEEVPLKEVKGLDPAETAHRGPQGRKRVGKI